MAVCISHRILLSNRCDDGIECVWPRMPHSPHIVQIGRQQFPRNPEASLERRFACRPAGIDVIGVHSCHGVHVVYRVIHRLVYVAEIS